ncbi:hypothetical protein GCWU000342_00870 [Shuttleworthella satelles DSM 14600]|uniref:Uncharacterized protein n=1 Tax=Shuttleworthella satelles DSM 14600 TaxID=626523 RepID=C4GA56_9FIRM|nr:hypothetical protein GCWU000342_00870 [Shuttleworthia satelles DSM 14600]
MRLERPVFERVHLRSKCTEKKRQRRGFEVTAFVENGRVCAAKTSSRSDKVADAR